MGKINIYKKTLPVHPRWEAEQIQWEGGFARPRCEFPGSAGESSSPDNVSSHHESASFYVRIEN